MLAVILCGGFGTRLRGLTLTRPKPIVEFIDKPIIVHQMEALKLAGVETVILALNYMAETVISKLTPYAENLGLRLIPILEERPMGTAGCLSLAKDYIKGFEKPFFMLNADIICNFPFDQLLSYHLKHGGEATIASTRVEDPSKYGVILHDDQGLIQTFKEKPKIFVSDEINSGIYCLNPSIVNRIKPIPTSIEKDIFPKIASEGKLWCFELSSFWKDIGSIRDYIDGTIMFLKETKISNYIHSSANVSENAVIINSVISPNVFVSSFARIENSIILEGSTIGPAVHIKNSIIGWNSVVEGNVMFHVSN
jgi:mannose-1-phosphate guanylyltransferase